MGNTQRKKIMNLLKRGGFVAPNKPYHPKTWLIRFLIVYTSPKKYSLHYHNYVTRWVKSHTAGGTSIYMKGAEKIKPLSASLSSWLYN